MVQSKARQERQAMKALNEAALKLPPRDLSTNSFWKKLGEPQLIAAPMVRHTDLPCRMVFRKYGTQLAYTSMIDSDRFIAAKDRTKYFSTHEEDRPLIAQFGATNAEDFVRAAEILQDSVDAVCLNMDCPQRRAAQQGFGAYLMKDNAEEVLNIVRRAKAELKVPVVAKIRLLSLPATVGNGYKSVPLVSKTIEFCIKMEEAGISMLAIHGRTIDMSNSGSSCRDSKNHRPVYPSDYSAINEIQKHLKIPVVANGDIRSMADVSLCLETTGADAAMVATELLYNPRLYAMPPGSTRQAVKPLQQLSFAAEYLYMCSVYQGFTPETLKSHLVDSIIVPCLSPERKREMIPFGEGVETREDAEERLLEIAILLGVLCGGKDECVALADVKGGLEGAIGVLREAAKVREWLGEEGGGSIEDMVGRVKEVFGKAEGLVEEFRGRGEGPKRKLREGGGEVGGGEEEKRKMLKKLSKTILKEEGGKMKVKILAKAVAKRLGEEEGEGATKKMKRTLKVILGTSKRFKIDGKIVEIVKEG
ncbi:hypothetical protein TrCOL_g3139 [Triparma columacea]|uniref:DUS-like FMN-binding domain-containing protein n=1 Tax=Triparma columacea TaxID=722753 RepID=A0A9W7FXF7_9STRA|nr:hypothetical protein TrCOL_g3139 [Triparma columacea]